ncbi:hypothetical protein [Defluviimonas sp. WL0075]|uniref:Uncharacterized protein n=1 Tax=Albidovulum sediminicola TaxID=2984331 RepID=A0ABT2Z435_9RHOB|nr:hypothetical protein [Defluviimonas sp. WL0075]MCV2865887.1 hypothetical protein [Defluviimonas sp. WL0075]
MPVCPVILSAAPLCPLPAAALCVANERRETLYLTVEAAGTGDRIAALRTPGERLCPKGSRIGTVAAFVSAAEIEGSSRLAAGVDRLRAFARFDRYTWASQQIESEDALGQDP